MSDQDILNEIFSGARSAPAAPPVESHPGIGTAPSLPSDGDSDVRQNRHFDRIVGRSPAIHRVLHMVKIIAPTDSTVLIQGKTGTGKELIARAIHDCSKRSSRPFVRLNCAAIPLGLLESELFGHEKGAFTGAVARKCGRFKMADRGTLFLDEIGEIPLEVQAKLLRVLQEGEFEMLGGTVTQKVDLRLVAATNVDLHKMVGEKRFRADLYYRVNVVPITVPSLRERREDIPLLIQHFVSALAKRMGKTIDEVPQKVIDALVEYDWPGNVREVQNLMERSVILSSGPSLQVPLDSLTRRIQVQPEGSMTLDDMKREHIIRALEDARGVVAGKDGAAARLGIKRSTLYFRMQKLGIRNRLSPNG